MVTLVLVVVVRLSLFLGELTLAILWMIMGTVSFSYAIGNLSSLLASFDSEGAKLSLKIEQMNSFCKSAKIDEQLRIDLKKSVEYASHKSLFSWTDKQKIFAELPPQMRAEVARQMYGGIVNKLKFFKDKDSTFISLVVPLLQPMKVDKYETIYTKGNHTTARNFY